MKTPSYLVNVVLQELLGNREVNVLIGKHVLPNVNQPKTLAFTRGGNISKVI